MDLSKFWAKSDEVITIKAHNDKLLNILKQIIDIYDIDYLSESLERVIKYHDIGKCAESMQKKLQGGDSKTIRHECISASVTALTVPERLAVLTHHKTLEEIEKSVLRKQKRYLKEIREVSQKLGIELEDIVDFILLANETSYKEVKILDNILLKGYLNYCDHLGSCNKDIKIDTGFNSLKSFNFENYNSIQIQAKEEKEDILIIAPTGLGKTATSLFWSNNAQNNNKSKRIYYVLPYTASINSLYKDFCNRDISTTMWHSKAEYFMNKTENLSHNDYKLLKYSSKQINICTIFQLAKSIFSCKRFEMLLGQLKNCIIVVDEIHCFDIDTLSYTLELLKYLKEKLNVRICVMSASIPTCLQELIKDRLGITKVIRVDKRDMLVRHCIHRVSKTIIDDIDRIKEDLNRGKQIIICVNNVDTSQTLYKMFSKDYQTKLIHGRFNTRDREKAEQGLKINQLLIGTQAIEVSLDIDYDVMYTEIAPFDALLQRFGRVNRKGKKGISDIYIYDNYKDCSFIYNDVIVERTDNVLNEIIAKDKSIILEEKTNEYLDKVYTEIDMKKYNENEKKLSYIINNLKLGNYNGDAMENMISNDNISIVPITLLEEYKGLIDNKEYLEAEALKVNINKKRVSWDSKNIYKDEDYATYVATYRYDEKIGLQCEKTI